MDCVRDSRLQSWRIYRACGLAPPSRVARVHTTRRLTGHHFGLIDRPVVQFSGGATSACSRQGEPKSPNGVRRYRVVVVILDADASNLQSVLRAPSVQEGCSFLRRTNHPHTARKTALAHSTTAARTRDMASGGTTWTVRTIPTHWLPPGDARASGHALLSVSRHPALPCVGMPAGSSTLSRLLHSPSGWVCVRS